MLAVPPAHQREMGRGRERDGAGTHFLHSFSSVSLLTWVHPVYRLSLSCPLIQFFYFMHRWLDLFLLLICSR